MKQTLNYGRISWSYEDEFDPELPCRPTPFMTFNPIRIGGKLRHLPFSDRVCLSLLKLRTPKRLPIKNAYKKWLEEGFWYERELGEGRAFFRWLVRNQFSLELQAKDFALHNYFLQKSSPSHSKNDEMAKGLTFSVNPVEVDGRRVKLYLSDEAVLDLIHIPYGEDEDFLELVRRYVQMRFKWESWRAPSPTFLDWTKVQAKRPIFSQGQLGFCPCF